jgi:diguanylate cyclase (GGDEF)-like protein
MLASSRYGAIIVLTLAMLGPSASAAAEPAVPAQSVTVPELPGAPSVTVTPGGDGLAALDAGVGEESVHVGAGPSGVSVNRAPRSAGAGGGGSGNGDLPVSAPGDRPGTDRPAPAPANRGGAVLFGPGPATASSLTRPSGSQAKRPGTTSGPFANASETAGAKPKARRSSHPFITFIEKIPDVVWAGLAALGLIALAMWAAWVRSRRRLEQNAFVDPITGLANAPAFDGLLARELERARRYKRPLALVLLDVSEARPTMMLPLLDQSLRNVTAAIQDGKREGDILARLGPSRFAVICPEATGAAAQTLARALEHRLESMRLHAVVGTAERQPTDTEPSHLEARAEERMGASYGPKSISRGRELLRVA